MSRSESPDLGGMSAETMSSAQRRRAVAAATIGNALEWYDFIVYSFFPATIGKLFFASQDPTIQVLLGFGTFGVGFFMRPLGAIVLGVYGDRAGRRASLTVTILLMMVGTAIITFAPTYASIGLAAPLLIVLARLIQGFSAGGEFAGATSFLSEYSLNKKRGQYVSWQQSSQFMASLLGAFIGSVVTKNSSPEFMLDWGWRIPFAVGLLIGPIGFYIRNRLDDTPAFKANRHRTPKSPLREAITHHWRFVIGGFGMIVYGTVSTYVLVLFLPTYATRQFGMASGDALAASALMSALLVVLCVLAGTLSDRIGRRPMLLTSSIGMIILVYPLLRFFASAPSFTNLLLIETVFAILIAGFTAPAPAMLAELFPTTVRNTAVALSYNFAVTIFGGFGPFIVAWLIQSTGDVLAPGYYVLAAAVISTVAVWPLPDRTGQPLA